MVDAPAPAPATASETGPVPVVFSASEKRLLSAAEAVLALRSAPVIFVGEEHDKPAHHEIQAAVLAYLAEGGRDVVLGLEMVDVTKQDALDAAVASGSEAALKEVWDGSWMLYEAYRPVLLAALGRKLRLAALNAPRPIVSRAARNGLESLAPAERALLAREIGPVQNPLYYNALKRSLEESGHAPTPESLRRYVFGMQIWNETMAENLIKERRAGRRVVMIAGALHLIYRGGIVDSVARRAPAERQLLVLPYPLKGRSAAIPELVQELSDASSTAGKQADLFWLLPASGRPLSVAPSPAFADASAFLLSAIQPLSR